MVLHFELIEAIVGASKIEAEDKGLDRDLTLVSSSHLLCLVRGTAVSGPFSALNCRPAEARAGLKLARWQLRFGVNR